MLLLVVFLCLGSLSYSVAEDYSFGNSLDHVDNVEVNASIPLQLPNITLFNIEGSGSFGDDSITLEIEVPFSPPTTNTAVIWILDLDRYSPSLNPIDEEGILRYSKASNCSTLEADRSLDSLFSKEGPTVEPGPVSVRNTTFFEAEWVREGAQPHVVQTFEGTYRQMEQCSRIGDKKVWSRLTTEKGIEYSATLYANRIEISTVDAASGYNYNFYTHTFEIRWRISRYILVSMVTSSIERVKAELVYTSVQPEIQNGEPTDRTQIFIGIKTVMKVDAGQALMLNYQRETGIFVTVGGEDSEVVQGPSSDERDNGCSISYDEQDQEIRNCEQVWEFSFLVSSPSDQPIVGTFFFELMLYTCDDIQAQDLTCIQLNDGQSIETITANLRLEQVVQVKDEKENYLNLVVESIGSPEGENFKYGDKFGRGIYHKEEVVIRVKPADNYQIIQDNGLNMAAFAVCIEEELDPEIRETLGCLGAKREHRYIAHLDDNIDLSLNGKSLKRDDFEPVKQSLNYHEWDKDLQNYDISFTNLALSGKARVYRITMLFTSAQNADDIDSYYDGEESRGKRSVVLHNVNKRDNHNETANATISEDTTTAESSSSMTTTTSTDNTASSSSVDSRVLGEACPTTTHAMQEGVCEEKEYSSANTASLSILLLAALLTYRL